MKISIPTRSLRDAVRAVSPAASGKLRPALGSVLIEAFEEGVSLSATDLEHGIRVRLNYSPDRPESVAVSADRLAAVLAEVDAADVLINSDGDTCTIRGGSARFELKEFPAAEHPGVPELDKTGAAAWTIEAEVLRSMIGRTVFACDRADTTRFALRGALWETSDAGKVVRLVATDSKRLAVCDGQAIPWSNSEVKGAPILPARVLSMVERLATEGEVSVFIKPTEALFRVGACEVYTRLLEGRFPPYREVLKQAGKGKLQSFEVPAPAFLAAIRQAAIMTDRETCRVDLELSAGRLKLAAKGAAIGASAIEMAMPAYDGPATKVAFDPDYFTDYLRTAGEVIRWELIDGSKPSVFRAGEDHTYLVMPLAV